MMRATHSLMPMPTEQRDLANKSILNLRAYWLMVFGIVIRRQDCLSTMNRDDALCDVEKTVPLTC